MSEQAVVAATRRQPLLTRPRTTKSHGFDAKRNARNRRRSRVGEVAGECAAVCCCFPCAMLHLLILVVYRLPAGLWRRMKRTRRSRKRRRRQLRSRRNDSPPAKENLGERDYSFGSYGDGDAEESYGGENDAVEWEDEMWERFYTDGFWRSASQREEDEEDDDDVIIIMNESECNVS